MYNPIQKSAKLRELSKRNKVIAGVVAASVAIVGYTIVSTLAATIFASLQPESGTTDNIAKIINDPNASGGKYIQFGDTAAVPPVPTLPPLPTGSTVTPKYETPRMPGTMSSNPDDLADDPAIWVNPTDPSKSVVFGASKGGSTGGIAVYDLQGKQLQFHQIGEINNVDVRNGMMLGGKEQIIVVGSNRTSNSLSFATFDPSTRRLTSANARTVTTGFRPYGTCLYKSATSGKYYAFVTKNEGTDVDQYELFDNGGKIDARKVRDLSQAIHSEGCVADDELGKMYVGEEDGTLWKYGAEPTDGTTRTAIGKAGDGKLVADIEGVTIAKFGNTGKGYLIVSSQGNSTFHIYERDGTNKWLRSFKVGSSGSIDSVADSDGLDIAWTPMGPDFPNGLFVTHDSVNSGADTSNFKFVDAGQVVGDLSEASVPAQTPTPSPTPAPTPTPAPGDTASNNWWGWDPNSTSAPPLLPELPWHHNTGVFSATDRNNLKVHNGDFTTTSNNQVIDKMKITGKVLVKHSGVVIKRSWVMEQIRNSTSSPVKIIHVDLGNGAAGDFKENGTAGPIHMYRSNVFGMTDGVMTQPGSGKDWILQDNFIHDLRYASDSTQSSGKTHNDGFQNNTSSSTTVLLKHNTFWMWNMNNYNEKETATRSSGPNWTDKGSALTSTGNTARDANPKNGLINAGVMIGKGQTGIRAIIDGNLFRGHTYVHLNTQAGYIEVKNNMFSTDENVSGRNIVAGRSNIDKWSGNTNYKTKVIIP